MIIKNVENVEVPFIWYDGEEDLIIPEYLFYYQNKLCGGFSFNESTCMFHQVCIFPSLWNQGLGTQMMKEAVAFIPGPLYLKTSNKIAYHIYKKIGFKTESNSNGLWNMKYERN